MKNPRFKWYVVHVYSGYEQRVKEGLLERIKSLSAEDNFGEVLIPTENVVEMVQGQKKSSKRKFFPGYILVEMDLTDDMWHLVKGTPKVTGFVGGASRKPTPVPEKEVLRLTQQISEGVVNPKLKMSFEKGENVRVVEGPFQNFNGIVDEVKPDKGKLRVLVSIFGRSTPVELDYAQVEKS
ncbi:transcription termination/antitermination protein NusG [bacterium]|nr:transcription termination/antitermination protein NusG [bacterium]